MLEASRAAEVIRNVGWIVVSEASVDVEIITSVNNKLHTQSKGLLKLSTILFAGGGEGG